MQEWEDSDFMQEFCFEGMLLYLGCNFSKLCLQIRILVLPGFNVHVCGDGNYRGNFMRIALIYDGKE